MTASYIAAKMQEDGLDDTLLTRMLEAYRYINLQLGLECAVDVRRNGKYIEYVFQVTQPAKQEARNWASTLLPNEAGE